MELCEMMMEIIKDMATEEANVWTPPDFRTY